MQAANTLNNPLLSTVLLNLTVPKEAVGSNSCNILESRYHPLLHFRSVAVAASVTMISFLDISCS